MILVALVLALQPGPAPQPPVRLCLPSAGGRIDSTIGWRDADGVLAWGSDRAPYVAADHAVAVGRPWFEAREPIVRDGLTYHRAGPFQETWPFNRYNRPAAPHDGVAVAEPLGGEGRALIVLTDPVGCWFERYETAPAE